MNLTHRPTTRLASESFDTETLALLDAMEVDLPKFGDLDLDVAFGTPLDMYEGSELPHERLAGLDEKSARNAIRARHDRLLAAADITADDPTIAVRVQERLVDVLLPYVAQLRIASSAAAAVLSAVA